MRKIRFMSWEPTLQDLPQPQPSARKFYALRRRLFDKTSKSQFLQHRRSRGLGRRHWPALGWQRHKLLILLVKTLKTFRGISYCSPPTIVIGRRARKVA